MNINIEEEKREMAIQSIAELMRSNPLSIEYKVVKKPKGIKVIFEVTQEEMNLLVKEMCVKANV